MALMLTALVGGCHLAFDGELGQAVRRLVYHAMSEHAPALFRELQWERAFQERPSRYTHLLPQVRRCARAAC